MRTLAVGRYSKGNDATKAAVTSRAAVWSTVACGSCFILGRRIGPPPVPFLLADPKPPYC